MSQHSLFELDKKRGWNRVHFSSLSVEWSTPQALYDQLDAEFNFALDAASDERNYKASKYFTKEDNALQQDWVFAAEGGAIFCNPPYSRKIGEWIEKGYFESQKGATVVMLLPARTDTSWFHTYCVRGEIRFVRGRLRFGDSKCGAPFPSMIVIFTKGKFEMSTETIQSQARLIDDLLRDLSIQINRRSRLESDLKNLQEQVKETRASLQMCSGNILSIEEQLTRKRTLPLFSLSEEQPAEINPIPEPEIVESKEIPVLRYEIKDQIDTDDIEQAVSGGSQETESGKPKRGRPRKSR